MEQMARALEIARDLKWKDVADPLFRPAKPPAPGMPGLVGRADQPQLAPSAAQLQFTPNAIQPQSPAPASAPQHQASSIAPLQATLVAQPAIIVDHPQPPTPAQPSETQGAAKPAKAGSESVESLCPWLEPGFYVSTSELQAVREPEAAEKPARDHRLWLDKFPNVEMKKADIKLLLQKNQQYFRNRGPWHSKFPDDSFERLHPLRIEPLSQISPDEHSGKASSTPTGIRRPQPRT